MNHQLEAVDIREVKKKITACIKLYHRDFREEAENFYNFVQLKRKDLIKESGEMVGGEHAIERILFEMPETLYGFIATNLSPEEFTWWSTKEGSRWFAKTFKKFSLVEV